MLWYLRMTSVKFKLQASATSLDCSLAKRTSRNRLFRLIPPDKVIPFDKMNVSEATIQSDSSTWPIRYDFPINFQPLSTSQLVYRYIVVIIGSVINIIVPVVICCSRQLHYPRHVFWVAVSVCNQLSIFQYLIEIVAIVGKNRIACQIFTLGASVYYTVILSFLCLGALDRYLAITRYEWYKRKVNNRRVVYLLMATFISTFIVITSPFWTRFKILENCTVNFTHMHLVLVYDFFLGILCVMLHIMTFIRSRAVISQHFSKFQQSTVAHRFHHSWFQASYVFNGE